MLRNKRLDTSVVARNSPIYPNCGIGPEKLHGRQLNVVCSGAHTGRECAPEHAHKASVSLWSPVVRATHSWITPTREVIVKRALVDIGQMGLVRTEGVGVHRSRVGLPRFPATNPGTGAFRLYDNGVVRSSPLNPGGWYQPWRVSVPELRKRQAEAACQHRLRNPPWR